MTKEIRIEAVKCHQIVQEKSLQRGDIVPPLPVSYPGNETPFLEMHAARTHNLYAFPGPVAEG